MVIVENEKIMTLLFFKCNLLWEKHRKTYKFNRQYTRRFTPYSRHIVKHLLRLQALDMYQNYRTLTLCYSLILVIIS